MKTLTYLCKKPRIHGFHKIKLLPRFYLQRLRDFMCQWESNVITTTSPASNRPASITRWRIMSAGHFYAAASRALITVLKSEFCTNVINILEVYFIDFEDFQTINQDGSFVPCCCQTTVHFHCCKIRKCPCRFETYFFSLNLDF